MVWSKSIALFIHIFVHIKSLNWKCFRPTPPPCQQLSAFVKPPLVSNGQLLAYVLCERPLKSKHLWATAGGGQNLFMYRRADSQKNIHETWARTFETLLIWGWDSRELRDHNTYKYVFWICRSKYLPKRSKYLKRPYQNTYGKVHNTNNLNGVDSKTNSKYQTNYSKYLQNYYHVGHNQVGVGDKSNFSITIFFW